MYLIQNGASQAFGLSEGLTNAKVHHTLYILGFIETFAKSESLNFFECESLSMCNCTRPNPKFRQKFKLLLSTVALAKEAYSSLLTPHSFLLFPLSFLLSPHSFTPFSSLLSPLLIPTMRY